MRRGAIVAVALFLGLVALPVTGAANEIANEPTCRDVNAGVAEPDPGEDCFRGSTARRAGVVGLLAISAVLAVLGMVVGAIAAVRGSSGILFALTTAAAVAAFFGAYGVARF